MTTRMSSKDQVVIPIGFRRKLRLVRDAEFLVEVEGDRVVLTPQENVSHTRVARWSPSLHPA